MLLQSQIAVLKDQIKQIEFAIGILDEPPRLRNKIADVVVEGWETPKIVSMYSDAGMTDAVVTVLDDAQEWFSLTALAQRLLDLGFDDSKHTGRASFIASVNVTLKRLKEAGRVARKHEDGKKPVYGSTKLQT